MEEIMATIHGALVVMGICPHSKATRNRNPTSKIRRNHAPQCKVRVALETLAGEKTIDHAAYNVHEIAAKRRVYLNQVTEWRQQLIDQVASVVGKAA